MYKSKIKAYALNEGVSIEEKVRKATETQTPLEAISPMIYTDAKDGVLPQHDIRTDRFELALEAINHYEGTELAKGDNLNINDDKDIAGNTETTKNE